MGGRATKIPIPGAEHAITSDEILNLESVPKRLACIGGGYISLEFASIYNHYGSDVHVVYRQVCSPESASLPASAGPCRTTLTRVQRPLAPSAARRPGRRQPAAAQAAPLLLPVPVRAVAGRKTGGRPCTTQALRLTGVRCAAPAPARL